MATSQTQTYKKLPGRKKNFLMGVHRLWLGKDHLLQVHARVGVENYQRFYFSDIQALVTRKTIAGKIYNALFGALALILGLTALSLDGPGAVFFYGAGGFFTVILGINTLMGPTCRTRLKTAVQQNDLPSLNRLRLAQRVMNRLRPLIRAVQGELSPAHISQGRVQERPHSPSAALKTRRPPQTNSPGAGETGRGKSHIIVAALLTASALLGLSKFAVNHMVLTFINMGLTLGLAIAAIVFLVQQYNTDRQPGMLTAAWSTVTYVVLTVISGYIVYFSMAFKHPEIMTNQWEQLKLMAAMSPWDSTFLKGLQLFFVVFAVILAVVIAILANARSTTTPVPSVKPDTESPAQISGRV